MYWFPLPVNYLSWYDLLYSVQSNIKTEVVYNSAVTKYTPVEGLRLYICKYQELIYLFAFWTISLYVISIVK